MKEQFTYPYENVSLEDMEGEIWKDIKGFEGSYMVSNLGRIKSLERVVNAGWKDMEIPTSIRRQDLVKNNSLVITLHISGQKHKLSIARLVYSAFVSPLPYSKSDENLVSHKNNDPLDNCLDNLFLISKREFIKSYITQPTYITKKLSEESRKKIGLAHSKAVSQYTGDGKFVRSYKSQTEASRITGIHQTVIGSNVLGRIKSAGGFIWIQGTGENRLSKSRINIFQNRKYNKPRPVDQLDLEGNYIRTFANTSKAAEALGFDRRKFSYRLSKGTFSINGYLWCYAGPEDKKKSNPFTV